MNETYVEFIERCETLAGGIVQNRNAIMLLLTKYETHESAKDEIERSLEALRGVSDELNTIHDPEYNLTLATFFPLNLPLYSLVLFGVIPSIFSSNIYIRPPEIARAVLDELIEILNLADLFPQIKLKNVPRHVFVSLYAAESDAIVFTGKYENAIAIHKKCPLSVMLYNGSGVNPIILFDNADVELAAKKTVEMRCFNSGQDCAGPDAIFVPSKLKDEFLSMIEVHLKKIVVGQTANPEVKIGPTMKKSYIDELQIWLGQHSDDIYLKGEIDNKHHLVYPTIISKTLQSNESLDFHEFFAPIFYVIAYESEDDLLHVAELDSFRDRAMYVSVFGESDKVESQLNFVNILKNKIVNDVEKGNEEYGGYGKKANFVLYGEEKIVKPILVNRDLQFMLARK
jgi:acyl-CoA reductase-like NAD-dependent aldehyde dehydrogenase